MVSCCLFAQVEDKEPSTTAEEIAISGGSDGANATPPREIGKDAYRAGIKQRRVKLIIGGQSEDGRAKQVTMPVRK